jgi:hypothetical protein
MHTFGLKGTICSVALAATLGIGGCGSVSQAPPSSGRPQAAATPPGGPVGGAPRGMLIVEKGGLGPARTTLPAGVPLAVLNTTPQPLHVTIAGLGIDRSVRAGKLALIKLEGASGGTYTVSTDRAGSARVVVTR